jgi:hypothetical protein
VLLPNGLQLQGVTPLTLDLPSEATTITLKRSGYLDKAHMLTKDTADEVSLTLEVDAKAAARAKASAAAKATAEKKAKRAKANRAKKAAPKKRKKKSRPGMLR